MEIITADTAGFQRQWRALWREDKFQYPFCTPLSIDYDRVYAAPAEFVDISFIVTECGQPVLGLLLTVKFHAGAALELSCFGRPIQYLESHQATPPLLSRACRLLKERFIDILAEYPGIPACYVDFLPTGNLSFLSQMLMAKGAVAKSFFTQVLDITQEETVLRYGLRKSYKSLINWGVNNLTLRVLAGDQFQSEDMERFRLLHIREAGRETRSKQTWDIQYEQARNGEAFVVLGDMAGELVTAAFFVYSEKYCYYGVSASKRALFAKPLSHGVIWIAILEARKRGCKYFEMGEQYFGHLAPTAKEMGICTFKRGFGGQTVVRMAIRLEQ